MRWLARTVGWLCLLSATSVVAEGLGNRLTYLDEPLDPYYVGRDSPRLATPQWVGEDGIEAVVVLAIDDMRDPQRYEQFLRPILERLKQDQGGANLSIMTNQVDPQDAQLQAWIKEGLSLEIHTIDHPCPLLCDGDFVKAKRTYDDCVDLLSHVPGNQPVAFRMPCCDSMNSPSPRFFAAVFEQVTQAGNFLSIDSSVFNLTTSADETLTPEMTTDGAGLPRFEKYLPFQSFVNTIRDYPYPYVIGRLCWEFPCMVPSDWEGQNLQQPNNPQTVTDLKAALDVAVKKQGVMNLVFHPHGWMRNDQVIELIDHAAQRHSGKVRFLTFAEAQRRLDRHLLNGHPLRNSQGGDNGVRLLDLNLDGFMDVVRIDGQGAMVTRVWQSETRSWDESAMSLGTPRAHFGICGPQGTVSMLTVADQRLRLHTWQQGDWQDARLEIDDEGLRDEWKQRLRQAADLSAVRLRDVDGDGACEILLCQHDDSLILRQVGPRWQAPLGGLPAGVRLASASGGDAGLRWVDLDHDGRDECLFSDAQAYSVHQFAGWEQGWRMLVAGQRTTESTAAVVIPPFIRSDGSNNGVWAHSEHLWWQNEDTARLPDKVDRLAFAQMRQNMAATGDSTTGGSATDPSETGASTTGHAETDAADDAAVFPGPLSPADALGSFRSSVGAAVELVAAEPLVEDPIAFDWGPDGRLWVVEMRDYPEDKEAAEPRRGRVKVLLDADGDGQYEAARIFLDGLHYPTGIKVWRDGVLVSGAPNLIFARDTNGDLQADETRVLYRGFGEGNQQHRVNGMRWGVDGWLYLANGESDGAVRSFAQEDVAVELGGRDLRIEPDSGQVEAISGSAQYGRARDDLGNWFGGHNSEPLYHYVLEDHYLRRNPHFAPPFVRRQVPEFPGPAPVFPVSRTLPRFNDFDRADRFTSACGPLLVTNVGDRGFGPEGSTDSYVCEPVHNLIHREHVEPAGVSFRSHRLPTDRESEFLASTDNWFRPVLIRSGPDDALWVADMYRLVIEHPEWIPRRWQAQLDVRAGTDRGRIYRVMPGGVKLAKTWPRLDSASTTQLVARLASTNRWQRDMAQQLLIWRNAIDAAAGLRELVQTAPLAVTRIQALHTLARLGQWDDTWWAEIVRTSEPAVARHAIALSEGRWQQAPDLFDAAWARVEAAPPTLQLQLAYSLGQTSDARAARALSHLALHSGGEQAIEAAVISSLTPANIRAVLSDALVSATPQHAGWLREVLLQTMAMGGDEAKVVALQATSSSLQAFPAAWRMETLGLLLDEYLEPGSSLDRLPPSVRQGISEVAESAQRTAQDASAEVNQRVAAVRLLRSDLADVAGHRDTLVALLEPRQDPEVQAAAAEQLLQAFPQESLQNLLPLWTGFSPRMRHRVLDTVLSQRELTVQLLRAAAEQSLDLGIDARRRAQLLESPDADVATAAQAILAAADSASRDEVIARYQAAGELPANEDLGRLTFQRVCATCHRIGDVGHAVGPDLAALSNKSVDFLLAAILDPNRAVESNYLDYLIETADGRQFSGILLAETANSVRLLGAEAKEQAILRHEIEAMRATGKSLMPEGLEKDITPEQMQALLSFLRTFAPQRKLYAGNQPRVAPVRDDGSIRLLAMDAEIFGPSLVYEERYRNLGFWASAEDYAAWTMEVPTAGRYAVTLDYACAPAAAGNRFMLVCGDEILSGEVRATSSWDQYDWQGAGLIELPAGRTRIMFRSEGPVQQYLLDLHQIVLEKAQ